MANSEQYKNQIRDFHDLDIAFQFADKSKTSNDQNVKDNLELLIKTLYKDILSTRRESDKKNIDKIEVVFSQQTNELLDKMGGLASIFDKAKTIVEEEIKNGKIEQQDKDKILSDVQKELQKRLDKYRKGEGREKSGDKITYVSPESKQLNEFTRNILNNEKLVKKMSDSLKGTVYGQTKKQSISIINLLTGNKYKELSLKIKKDNISRISTLTGKTTKLQVFSKIKEFKNSEKLGKMFNHRTILKHFKVKRQKLDKRGFLGLYNQYVYKELIRRVDEFSNVLNFKGKMGKAILKSVLKWGGGFIVSGITKTLGFGWKMMKSAVKQIFNITKAVGKMGVSIFRRLRNFIFTKTGMWIVGFFSGVIYAAVIEPLVKKFKAWFDIILKPIRKFFGFQEGDEYNIETLKKKISNKILDSIEKDIKDGTYVDLERNLIKISDMLINADKQIRDIDMFVNGGGLGKSAAKAASGMLGTIGTLVGAAVGSIFPGAGTLIGAAVGGAIGGFAESMVNYFVDRLPMTDNDKMTFGDEISKMRKSFEGTSSKGISSKKHIALFNLKEKESKLQKELESVENDDTLNEEQKQEKKKNINDDLSNVRNQIQNINSFNISDDNQEEYNKAKLIKDLLQDDKKNYFKVQGFENDKTWDGFNYFWSHIKKGEKPEEVKVEESEDDMQNIIAMIKKHAMVEAVSRYFEGKINFDTIMPIAYSYMMEMMKTKEKIFEYKNKNGKIKYTDIKNEYQFKGLDFLDRSWYQLDKKLHFMQDKTLIPYIPYLRKKFYELYYGSGDIQFKDKEKYFTDGIRAEIDKIKNIVQNGQDFVEDNNSELTSSKNTITGLGIGTALKSAIEGAIELNDDNKERGERLKKMLSKQFQRENDTKVSEEISEEVKLTEKKNGLKEQKKQKLDIKEKNNKILFNLEKNDPERQKKIKQIVEHPERPMSIYMIQGEQDDGTSANDEGGISYLYNRNTPQKPSWMK